jgi:hypothetical protein
MSMSISPVGPMTTPSQTPQAMTAALKDSQNTGDPRGATAAVNNRNAAAHNATAQTASGQNASGQNASGQDLKSIHKVDIKA